MTPPRRFSNDDRPPWRYSERAREMKRQKDAALMHEIVLVQRVSESRKTAGLIKMAMPGGFKAAAWQKIKKHLDSGEGC